tara:strand:- start:3546 stop:4166 length:621 start_codon:yes stop_codon:yes gene_type:complete
MPSHYDKPMNPNAQGLGSVAGETVGSFTTGPQTPGMGPVTNQEMDKFMEMRPSRQDELQQRAYQSYMDALGRLRQQEAQGLAPSTAPAADAQNRLNEVRSGMNAARAQMPPAIDLEDYFNQRNAGMGSMIGQPVGSDIEAAVQSGQMSPADAASAATGLPNPFNQMPRAGGALGGLEGVQPDKAVEDAMPLANFLKNLFNKQGAAQ